MPVSFRSFKWKWFFKAAAVVTIGLACCSYIVLSPFVGEWLYNMVLFHPWKYPDGFYGIKSIKGVKPQDRYIETRSHGKIHAWYFPVANARYTVLLSHGNGGNLTLVADNIEMFLDHDLSVLAYDYEGYGRSAGAPSLSRVFESTLAAYRYLTDELKIPAGKIILFGESFGTAVSGDLASKAPCGAIILQCPLASVRRRGVEICDLAQIYPDFLWPESGFDNVRVFAHPHPPLLLIAGTKDQMIPVGHADELYKTAAEPKTYIEIEGAGHSHSATLMNSALYKKGLSDFLERLP